MPTLDIYTRQEVDDLLAQQEKRLSSQFERAIRKMSVDKLPPYLSTTKMAELLGIKPDTLRQRKDKRYFIGTHYFKVGNGNIRWDKCAVMNERRENEIL